MTPRVTGSPSVLPPRATATRRAGAAIAASAAVALVLGAASYGAFAALAPVPAIAPILEARAEVVTPPPEVSLPGYGAAAIGAADSEQVFAGRDLDTPRPMASITKVITALVVLDARPIDDAGPGETITLSAADSRLPGQYRAINGSWAPAPAGATLTQRQIIELMIVRSANNYAETLATWAFGSVDAYLVAARDWLDANGLPGISVADTTGFSLSNTASPRDLLALARLALDNPVVSAAGALPVVSVPGVGTFENTNRALGVDGVTGLKTGTLRAVGAGLLFVAREVIEGEEVTVVGVVLAGPDQPTVAADVRTLLASVRDDYHQVTLGQSGDVIARYETEWGSQASLHLAETVDDIVWGDVRSIGFVQAPQVQPGLPLPDPGDLTVRYGEVTVSIPLEWRGELEAPDLAWRLAQPITELLGE